MVHLYTVFCIIFDSDALAKVSFKRNIGGAVLQEVENEIRDHILGEDNFKSTQAIGISWKDVSFRGHNIKDTYPVSHLNILGNAKEMADPLLPLSTVLLNICTFPFCRETLSN